MPEIRDPDGQEIASQLDLREEFELFAGLRLVQTWLGMTVPLADPCAQSLGFMLIRKSTERIFADRGKTRVDSDEAAHATMTITRRGSKRSFNFAFDLAHQRRAVGHKRQCALIDKANVQGGLFLENLRETGHRLFRYRPNRVLCRRGGAEHIAPALDVRRDGHREYVQRYLL
jgi:3-isopropylmalate dehydrogenase